VSATPRVLGASHVAAVVIGATVGVGIFFTPAALARAVPSPAWALGLWLFGGLTSLVCALVFADLGVRWPSAGGLYVFLRDGYGGAPGSALSFLYGWLQLLVVQPGAMAVIAVVLADHVPYFSGPISGATRALIACGSIVMVTAANLVGLRAGGRVQVAMAIAKLAALALLILVGIRAGVASRVFERAPGLVAPGGISSWVLFGLIPILFTFGGAYHGTFIAGAVKDPERALPRGITLGVAVVLVAYLGVNAALFGVLGHARLAASESPAADAIAAVFGPWAGRVVAGAILVSAAGILNTVCLGFPFVLYAMAKDGAFIERAGRLDHRTGRPAFAVALQGSIACAGVLLGSSRIDVLLTGIAFADATFLAAVAFAHVRVRARRIAPPLGSLVLVAIEVGIAIGCLVRAPRESAYGAASLVVGAIVWFVWRRK
jgi:basic amino acid/polyamine antiporter, APA family